MEEMQLWEDQGCAKPGGSGIVRPRDRDISYYGSHIQDPQELAAALVSLSPPCFSPRAGFHL